MAKTRILNFLGFLFITFLKASLVLISRPFPSGLYFHSNVLIILSISCLRYSMTGCMESLLGTKLK